MKTRLAFLLVICLVLPAAPAAASHYGKARAGSGPLSVSEVRLEIRRILRQRGFAKTVTAGLQPKCRRRSPLRFECRYSRRLEGGNVKLRGDGVVSVGARSSGSLLRYRLDTTVSTAPPCATSQTVACVERFRFTHTNHQRVKPPAPPAPPCGLPPIPGTTTETIVVGGVQRTYLKVVPASVVANRPVPVIMGFHGGNDTAQAAEAYMGLTSADPVLYVYPQGARFGLAWAGWNVDPAGADFPFVDAILADLKSRHCVDPARVFAAGKSNGAFFVNSLLCHRAASFRAAASVAGGGRPSTCAQPRAYMGIHGSADRTVPISTGIQSRDRWLADNRYANAPIVAVDPSPCASYPGTLNRVVWCGHPGGHIWPGWAGAAIRSFFLGL
ncbi:MAG: polyhydroxybutyrate depolymerase [Solirubrobacteraceae bacterium]|nr:polyhydroxybutyrate depolymerase [Solirubrobacteraceae bacterium]